MFTVFRKSFCIVWLWAVLPFRKYARNTVYNYKLQNNLWLKRLYERNPTYKTTTSWCGWILTGDRTVQGSVEGRKVFWLEYQLVYWVLWGWLDDDSNHDTTDMGYIRTIVSGERNHWLGSLFVSKLKKELTYLETQEFGNTFELGDKRVSVSVHKCLLSTLLWSCLRNGAYNFRYDQWETTNEYDVFKFNFRGKVIGWSKEGVVQGRQNYSLRFFEKGS